MNRFIVYLLIILKLDCFLNEHVANLFVFNSSRIFNLYSGKFPYLQENGSIKVKQDSTIPYKTPQQLTEQIHTVTNFKEAVEIIAFVLTVFTLLCVIFMLCDFYVFDRISKFYPM